MFFLFFFFLFSSLTGPDKTVCCTFKLVNCKPEVLIYRYWILTLIFSGIIVWVSSLSPQWRYGNCALCQFLVNSVQSTISDAVSVKLIISSQPAFLLPWPGRQRPSQLAGRRPLWGSRTASDFTPKNIKVKSESGASFVIRYKSYHSPTEWQ